MAASFVLGIFLVGSTHLPSPAAAALPVCVAVCLLAGLLVMRAGWERVSLLLALLGFLAAGASAGCLFEYRFPVSHVSKLAARGVDLEEPLRLAGHIASTPRRTAYGFQFDLETERAESRTASRDVTGKVRLRLEGSERAETWARMDELHLQYGDAIRVLVRLRKPRIYQNPGSFDFRRWMESTEDIYWVGTLNNPRLVEKLAGSDRGGISTLPEQIRNRLLHAIDHLYPRWSAQGRCGSVLKAVLLGDRSALDSETIESFRKTGLYHLLVIAGLHVGLLALLADCLLRLVGLGARARRLTVLALLIFYAFLVEQRAPTLRATLMIGLYLLAGLLHRRSSTLNAIGLAALVLLLWRPAWLFESGFQLSFSAALLIAGLAVPILERTTEPYRRALGGLNEIQLDAHIAPRLAQFRVDLRVLVAWLKSRLHVLDRHDALAGALVTGPARALLWAANMLLFSAVLQVGLLLPMATTFHRVALAGIGLNALAIPVMTLLLALAVPTVVLAAVIPVLAVWPAKVLAFVMAGLFALTGLPHLPAWLSFRVPNPPLWVSCGFVVFILAAALALGRRQASASDVVTSGLSPAAPPLKARSLRAWALSVSLAGLGVMTVLVATHPFPPRLPTGRLEVTALDCGQGESLFVVLPDRTTMLVDGSGSRQPGASEGALQGRPWDPGEDIISPYLWSRGIKKIDIVVLSIPHEDHLGGLFAVARNFRIGEFWHAENGAARAYWDLLEKLREKGVVERTLEAGDNLERGGATVRALWPERSLEPAASFSNDDSLVLRIAYGGDSVLLTGDITAKAERQLLASGQEVSSLVLKVAHHGSNSSSSPEFLARVNPRVALVTGGSNDFGNLPGQETLARLRDQGIRTFRPEVDGATTVEMAGRLRAMTFRPPNP
jgi:competence protein ComEC